MRDYINKLNKLITLNNRKKSMNNCKSKKIQILHLSPKLIIIIRIIRVKVHNQIKINIMFSLISLNKCN